MKEGEREMWEGGREGTNRDGMREWNGKERHLIVVVRAGLFLEVAVIDEQDAGEKQGLFPPVRRGGEVHKEIVGCGEGFLQTPCPNLRSVSEPYLLNDARGLLVAHIVDPKEDFLAWTAGTVAKQATLTAASLDAEDGPLVAMEVELEFIVTGRPHVLDSANGGAYTCED